MQKKINKSKKIKKNTAKVKKTELEKPAGGRSGIIKYLYG